MEYFKFEYKNVDKEICFTNYDTFVTNMKIYKYYLFDLALLQHDTKVDTKIRNEAKFILTKQKALFILPYLIIFPTIFYYNHRNFFTTKMLNKEVKLISILFGTLMSIRVAQKALLKYDGDKILIDISKNKLHSI